MPKPHTRLRWIDNDTLSSLVIARESGDVSVLTMELKTANGWQVIDVNPVLALSRAYQEEIVEGHGPAKMKAAQAVGAALFSLYEKVSDL